MRRYGVSRFYPLEGAVKVVLQVLALVLVGLVLSCGPASTPKALHRGNGAEPGSLDPQKAVATQESRIITDLLVGLTSETANGDMIPAVAETWTTSEDGLVWTFKLRTDILWS